MKERLLSYSKLYHELMDNKAMAEQVKMPGKAYFIEEDTILAIPRDDGDCRYPYGKNGFNYWTYASGYMHCNEGLFSPFLRANEGGEPKIAFFGKTEGVVVPLLSVPVMNEIEGVLRYTIFTKAGTYFITEFKKIIFGIRTFVDEEKQIYFTVEVINNNADVRCVEISSYFNPFIKNALMENSTDRWFRQVNYVENDGLGSFVVEAYEERDRMGMATNYGVLTRQSNQMGLVKSCSATTSRYEYVGGSRSSLHTAASLEKENFSEAKTTTSFTETAICGDKILVTVEDAFRYDICFSYGFDESFKNKALNKKLSSEQIDVLFKSIEFEEDVKNQGIQMLFEVATEDSEYLGLKKAVFNPFMEHLKKQVEFCSVIKGYVQLSSFSLIGIRDVFQALEGLVYWQPIVVREKMLEAFNFLNPQGRFPRQYSLPSSEGAIPAMDLRPFIDQGVWVISTMATYLRFTKDTSILFETCGYYDFVDEHKHIVRKSTLSDQVIDHLVKVMNYLIENRDIRDTKCVLALYGDWNDALDGLGRTNKPDQEYGTGVSVMATLQVYQNIDEMINIIELVNRSEYNDLIPVYKQVKQEIFDGLVEHALTEDRIIHGWGDDKSYLVGSQKDPDGLARDGLTSNAFWVLSGLFRDMNLEKQKKIKEIILNAYKRLDSKYGLKTFEPPFTKGTLGVGRIPNLPAGTAENGATYIHASMFGVMSLFALGEGRLGWIELAKLLPFTHEKISVSPYVAPNSYGFNERLGIDGESMQDWQTGSSNVLLKLIIRYVFGFEPVDKGVRIQPSSYQPFGSMHFNIRYLNKNIVIKIVLSKRNQRNFKLNGKLMEGVYDPVMQMQILEIEDSFIELLESDLFIEVEL